MIIAQGKTAEAAALGNAHPEPTLPFFRFGAPAGWRAKPEKGEQIIFRSEPKAVLVPRLPWAIIRSSPQDLRLGRSLMGQPSLA
jgi:hypothetical protein